MSIPEQRTSSNVVDIATTVEQRLTQLRHRGVRRALRFIDMGHRRAALEFLMISFEEQARTLGHRDVRLPRPVYPDIEP